MLKYNFSANTLFKQKDVRSDIVREVYCNYCTQMKTLVCPDPNKFHRWYEQKGLMKYTSKTLLGVNKILKPLQTFNNNVKFMP